MIKCKHINDELGRRVRVKEGMSKAGVPVRVISVIPPEGLIWADKATVWMHKLNRTWKAADFYRFTDWRDAFEVRYELCLRCDGTGDWVGTHSTKDCFGCDGTGVISVGADKNFPIYPGGRYRKSTTRLCDECHEPTASLSSRLCPSCRRALWADKTDWTPEHADRMIEMTDGDAAEKLCDCERGTRIHWLDAQRVCNECWTEAYQPQLSHPAPDVVESTDDDHLSDCTDEECELCDHLVAA